MDTEAKGFISFGKDASRSDRTTATAVLDDSLPVPCTEARKELSPVTVV